MITVENYKILHHYVLLDIPQTNKDTNVGNIIIPETIKNGMMVLGTVLKTGPGGKYKNKIMPMEVKVGDKVWVHRVLLIKDEHIVMINDKKYLLVPESEIVGIVED